MAKAPVPAVPVPESTLAAIPPKKRQRPTEMHSEEKGKAPQTIDEPRRKRGRPRKVPVAVDVDLTAASTLDCSEQHPCCQQTFRRLRSEIEELTVELAAAKVTTREASAQCDQLKRSLGDMLDHMRVNYGYTHDPDY
jgi:hypothetical protein